MKRACVALLVGLAACGTPTRKPWDKPTRPVPAPPAKSAKAPDAPKPAEAPKPPAPPTAPPLSLVAAALEGASGAADAAAEYARFEESSGTTTGLADSLAFLAAVRTTDRADRLAKLEDLADDAEDKELRKAAVAELERDERYLAEELASDSRYSAVAGFFNGVLRIGASALSGDPIGVLQPVVLGIEGLIQSHPLDPRDRKRVDLNRQWLLRQQDPASLSEEAEEVRDAVEELRRFAHAEEIELARRLAARGRADAALAHLHVAESIEPGADENRELEAELRAAIEARSSMLSEALGGDAEEAHLVDLAKRDERVRDLERALASPLPPPVVEHPLAGIDEAKSQHRRDRARYVFTGDRSIDDPLAVRAQVRADLNRSAIEHLWPLFWVPATLVRAIYNGIADPVDDRGVIDAEAYFLWRHPEHPERREVLADLSSRLERRGDLFKAWASAKAAALGPEELSDLEDEIADKMLDETAALPLRRARAEWLVEQFPGGGTAQRAKAALAKMPPESIGQTVPMVALAGMQDALGIETRLTNGDPDDGEMDPPRLEVAADRIRFTAKTPGGATMTEERPIPEPLRTEVRARVGEWLWLAAATKAETYREQHAGVPVEFFAGLGVTGVSVYPRLLPEEYFAADRKLYE